MFGCSRKVTSMENVATARRKRGKRRTKKRPPHERLVITPIEVASQLGVDAEKVRDWIDAGELQAIVLTSDPKKKKQRRLGVTHAALAAFLERRSTAPPLAQPQPRKKRCDESVTRYF